MMKKFFGMLILLSMAHLVMAQEMGFRQNSIAGKDSLQLKRISLKEFNIKSDGEGWSLKDVGLSKKDFRIRYNDGKDTIIAQEPRARVIYRQTERGISIIGAEDNLLAIQYDQPEEWLRFPMTQKDTLSGEFSGKGVYCKQIPIQRRGTYKTAVESVDSMILPEGEVLKEVACLHTERQITDITEYDRMQQEQHHYRWYAKGYRYPILEAIVSSREGNVFEEVAFYCPLEEQEKLESDRDNKAERTRAKAESPDASDDDNGFAYKIASDGNGITIDYQSDGPAKVVAILASNQGYVYQRRELNVPAGTGQLDLSTNGLRRGQYVVYLNVNGKDHAEKVNLR